MLSALAQSLLLTLQHDIGLPARSSCLLAVSGGGDSVAMVHLFAELQPLLDLKLHIVHLNHELRMEAKQDSDFVQHLAHQLHIPCTIKSRSVEQYARQHRLSVEEAGRKLRYRLFAHVRSVEQLDYIITAHTADDQAETILMRLIAGTSLHGLGGVRPQSCQRHLLRPLLSYQREQLRQYLIEHNYMWCEDATNLVPAAPRTRVRLLLLPLIKEWNPRITESIARLTQSAREDEKFLTAQAVRFLKSQKRQSLAQSLALNQTPSLFLKLDGLRRLQRPIRLRVYRLGLKRLGCACEAIHLHSLDALLEASVGKRLCLPNKILVQRMADGISCASAPDTPPRPLELPILQLPDLTTWYHSLSPDTSHPDYSSALKLLDRTWGLAISFALAPVSAKPEKDCIYLNPHALSSSMQIRQRQPGDRFFPAGGNGSTKLKKYLNELAIPLDQRNRVPLLICNGELVWVIGYRADQRFLAKPCQRDVIKVSFQASPDYKML